MAKARFGRVARALLAQLMLHKTESFEQRKHAPDKKNLSGNCIRSPMWSMMWHPTTLQQLRIQVFASRHKLVKLISQ